MGIAAELRRAGFHLVGIAGLLALYCAIAGNDAGSGAFALAGAALLVPLTALRGPPRLRPPADESDDLLWN
jgi:hypothetical protein